MRAWLRHLLADRPWWMNAVLLFSGYMTFFYIPWDLFAKPVAQDAEVWFGVVFTGWSAKLLTLPHWIVYAAAIYGIRRNRPWMRFWAPAYCAQVAIGMFLWPVFEYGGLTGPVFGLIAAAPFAALTAAFWNERERFSPQALELKHRYGGWALVTGASAGIGAEFARQLAAEGMPLVLTARREERLHALADELHRAHGVETRIVAADLATEEGPTRILDAVADLEIGVLVNNAGLGGSGRFDKLERDALRSQVMVNCLAPVLLTHGLVRGMRERGRGAVIFTGSVAGRQPLPLHAVYSATKAFDLLLGEALWVELEACNVDVLVLEPGSTESEFQTVAGQVEHGAAPVGPVVKLALESLGRQPSVIAGWGNFLRAELAGRLGPRPLVAHVAHAVTSEHTRPDLR